MERFGSRGNFLIEAVHLERWSSLTGRSSPAEGENIYEQYEQYVKSKAIQNN